MIDLYKLLGIKRGATRDEVRKAYRRKAKTSHPDSGGSVEQFGVLATAHEVLSDARRREKYDATGEIEPATNKTKILDELHNKKRTLQAAIASQRHEIKQNKLSAGLEIADAITPQAEEMKLAVYAAIKNLKEPLRAQLEFYNQLDSAGLNLEIRPQHWQQQQQHHPSFS